MPILPYKIGTLSWSPPPGETLALSPFSLYQIQTFEHPANLPAQEPTHLLHTKVPDPVGLCLVSIVMSQPRGQPLVFKKMQS